MYEETDDSIWNELTKEMRDEEEVVVVYPDEVARFVDLRDTPRIDIVRFLVFAPVFISARSFGRDVLP